MPASIVIAKSAPNNIIKMTIDIVTICIVLTYLFILPTSAWGLLLTSLVLLLYIIMLYDFVNLGIYMLLFGMKTFGIVSIALGLPGVGGKIAFIIGILSLILAGRLRIAMLSMKPTFLWLLLIFCVLIVSYYLGPQSEYSRFKLINTAVTGLTSLVAFYFILKDSRADWFRLGQLGILSGLVCLGAIIFIAPELKPNNIMDFSSLRDGTEGLYRDIVSVRNTLSHLPMIGAVVLYSASPDKELSTFRIVKQLVYLVSALLIILLSGSRLPVLIVTIVCLSIQFMKPKAIRRYFVMSFILISMLVSVIIYGISTNIRQITFVFDSSKPILERTNRDSRWMPGISLFLERPLFGHGLGGYYVEGLSLPGDGSYPHNLILELLSETGLVGLGMILIFPLILGLRLKKALYFKTRAPSGGAVFSLLIMALVESMISFDLTTNIQVFSIAGLLGTKSLHYKIINKVSIARVFNELT